MKIIKRLVVLLSLLPFLFTNTPTVAQSSPQDRPTQQMQVEVKELDPRAQILKAYFAKYDSPLEDHAQDFIDAADTFKVDWKLLPSITGVESTFGKFVPGGSDPTFSSHNGWGWGVYGTQAIYFKNWREGIFTVTAGLKQNYIDKGLTTPTQINPVYAASPTWGSHVNFFLQDLEQFAQSYTKDNPVRISDNQPLYVDYLQQSLGRPQFKKSVVSASGQIALAN